MKKKNKKKFKFAFLIKFFIKIAVLTAVIYLVLTYVLCVYRMEGNNMFPALKDGDLCIFYRLEECYSGDVVAYEDKNRKTKIGRIVAIHDQDVDFPEAGGYTVDSYQPTEEITYQTFAEENSKVVYPVHLGSDEVFILNDFRSDTDDGRSMGAVKTSKIKGKLIFILRRRGF